jgi:hypothetical protein
VSIKSQLTLSKYWVWFFSSQYQYQYQFLIVNISTPNKSYCFYIFFHTVTFLTLNSYYFLRRYRILKISFHRLEMFRCSFVNQINFYFNLIVLTTRWGQINLCIKLQIFKLRLFKITVNLSRIIVQDNLCEMNWGRSDSCLK